MILAGIDMGIEATKAVVLRDGAIIGRAKASTGGTDRPIQARQAYDAALAAAGIAAIEVEAVSATGIGKYDVPFAGRRVTEVIAAAHGAGHLCPGATAVMSVGAGETLIAALGADRLIDEYALSQKCTAGVGLFLRTMADRLGIPLDLFGDGEAACVPTAVSDGCMVFAELDALSMLNRGAEPQTVAAACIRAAAVRAANTGFDLTVPNDTRTVLIGGTAKNRAFVRALEAAMGIAFIIPAGAEYAGAVGAAISGAKGLRK